MNLILVRHGENDLKSHEGEALTENGRKFADNLEGWLRDWKYLPAIKRIYSSDVERCKETVAGVAKARGLEIRTWPVGNPPLDEWLDPGNDWYLICYRTIEYDAWNFLPMESYEGKDVPLRGEYHRVAFLSNMMTVPGPWTGTFKKTFNTVYTTRTGIPGRAKT